MNFTFALALKKQIVRPIGFPKATQKHFFSRSSSVPNAAPVLRPKSAPLAQWMLALHYIHWTAHSDPLILFSEMASQTSTHCGGSGGGHCGLEIVGVEDRDRGSWECEVGAVINDDFKTKTDNIVLDVKSKLKGNGT